MEKRKLPIVGYPYQNIEDMEKKNQPHRLVEGYVNEAGHYVLRPGFSLFATLGTSAKVWGMYYWREMDAVVAVSNQNVYKVQQDGTVTDITNNQLSGAARPSFAECLDTGVSYLAIADGGTIVSWDGSGTTTAIADGDAPTAVDSLDFIDQYLITTNSNKSIYFSDQNNFDSWTAANTIGINTDADNADAILVSQRDIYVFGKNSIEIWASTGSSAVFEQRQGVAPQDGCIAPYTILDDKGVIYYFNNERRLIRLEGRTPSAISVSMDSVFAGFTTVTDATGDLIVIGGRKFYLLQFPTEGKSYICDLQNNFGWAEWMFWDNGNSEYIQYKGACALYVPDWGKMLIGHISDGKIYQLSTSTYGDGSDYMRFLLRTGHIDHGDAREKFSHRLRLRLKRGVATDTETDPVIQIRFRDDGTAFDTPEAWTSMGLGQTGENEFYAELDGPLGSYRSRQYEIIMTDIVQLILTEIEEEFSWGTR